MRLPGDSRLGAGCVPPCSGAGRRPRLGLSFPDDRQVLLAAHAPAPMPINELRSIQTFVKTAELGSLRRAAAAQGITPQAASQTLAQLEQHLGVRLFQRTT